MDIKNKISEISHFLNKGVWLKDLKTVSFIEKTAYKILRILIMTFREFNKDRVQLRASALTYYSLLSIVPIFAMAFGIAKGFGLDEKLNALITEKLSAHQDIMVQVIDFANRMLNNTKGGLIAGVGVIVLFWSVLKVMSNIEESFNAIWGISKGRSLIKKFTEYVAIIIFAPLMLILSSSLTVFISSATESMINKIEFLRFADAQVSFLMSLSPYVIFWLLLTMVYMIMPNTKVHFKSALIAGIISGTLFVIVQWAYVKFQIGVSQFNAIYGSFAALPLFLMWLRISWMIVLFGAELSFAHQNLELYRLKNESENISIKYSNKLSIYITHFVVKNFFEGKASSLDEIKNELNLPYRIVAGICEKLVDSGIFSKIETPEYKELVFQPGIDTSKLTVRFLINKIEELGADEIPQPDNEIYKKINEKVEEIYKCGDDTPVSEILV